MCTTDLDPLLHALQVVLQVPVLGLPIQTTRHPQARDHRSVSIGLCRQMMTCLLTSSDATLPASSSACAL